MQRSCVPLDRCNIGKTAGMFIDVLKKRILHRYYTTNQCFRIEFSVM